MGERVHNRLAVVRAEHGVSRRELAEAVGAHYQTIGHLERGQYNPSLDLALRIAGYFALPVEAVFALRPFAPLSAALYPREGATPAAGAEQRNAHHTPSRGRTR